MINLQLTLLVLYKYKYKLVCHIKKILVKQYQHDHIGPYDNKEYNNKKYKKKMNN